MTHPRIYTYKVTFEEIPDWYWGIHKELKYGEHYLGSPVTHRWKWEFYTPHLQILEEFEYSDQGWKIGKETEDRLILPDLNNPLCLNEAVAGVLSLESCRRGGRNGAPVVNAQKHSEKDHLGRSTAVMRMNEVVHSQKDELGRSSHAVKCAERLNSTLDDRGKSLAGVRGGSKGGPVGGKTTSSQLWVDPDHPELGLQNAGNLVRMQKRRGFPHAKENRERVE
jgi:hypothetical protein